MSCALRMLACALFLAPFSQFGYPQNSAALPVSAADTADRYPDSAYGLRSQLLDALGAAKDHNRQRLETLVRQMEIPNYEQWFMKTYGKEKGESWAEPYGRDLGKNESDLVSLFLEMAGEEGQLGTRKVNDAPTQGMESAMIGALQRPADIFYAGWKLPPPRPPFSNELIGYFVYLDGRFRWDSTIRPMKVQVIDSTKASSPEAESNPSAKNETVGSTTGSTQSGPFHPGRDGVGFPACLSCPTPAYTEEARAKHIEGTVVLEVVVQPDGRATNIKVLKAIDTGLTEMAIESVRNWRFKAAPGPDGKPVAVLVPIEVTFRLAH